VDAGQTKTPVGDKVAPKKPKPTQKLATKKKGGATKKDAQAGKKDTASQQKDQGAGATGTQGTPSTSTPQEPGPPKWPISQSGGTHKKEKVHKEPPEYTITEDDADLVAEKVQDRVAEDFEEASTKGGRYKMTWLA
jgi:hypothetical protein